MAGATAAQLPPTPPPTDAQRMAAATTIVEQIFGQAFVFVTEFSPSPSATVGAALTAGPALVGDPYAAIKWLQQASRVREPLGRWRTARLLRRRWGRRRCRSTLRSSRWLPARHRRSGSDCRSHWMRTACRDYSSVALARPSAPAATDTWYGLMIDEWVELIPNATEITGLAFHYDVARGKRRRPSSSRCHPCLASRGTSIRWPR